MNERYALLLAGGIAFVTAAIVGPAVIRALRKLKFGQKILEDGPKWHMSKQNTPTMGGLIFILGIAVAVGISVIAGQWGDPRPLYMLALSLVFGAIGFIDDYTKVKKKRNKGLTAMQKLLLQIAAAALFLTVLKVQGYLAPQLDVPFFGLSIVLPWGVYLLFSIFVIVGAVNAVNLTDGIDGLCSSVTAVVALYFCAVYAVRNMAAPSVFSAALLGGLLGFLLYNRFPARVFMGDTGSLFLGGAVCSMAFVYNVPLILVPVGLVYIVETLSDILQVGYYKLSGGKRIFKMAPIHHHFEMCGWSERKIVAVFTAVTALSCTLTLLFA